MHQNTDNSVCTLDQRSPTPGPVPVHGSFGTRPQAVQKRINNLHYLLFIYYLTLKVLFWKITRYSLLHMITQSWQESCWMLKTNPQLANWLRTEVSESFFAKEGPVKIQTPHNETLLSLICGNRLSNEK